MLIASSVLAISLSKIFFSFLLLDIVLLNSTLRTVIKAFGIKTRQIILTTAFGLILIYTFTVIMYYSTLRAKMKFIDDDNFEMCNNLFHCYLVMINFGARTGGGIGETVLYPHYDQDTDIYIYRVIFDMVFFVLINILILDIIFGLIIDSFQQLRQNRTLNRKYHLRRCLIPRNR